MNFIEKYRLNRALKQVSDYDIDDILDMVGLEQQSIAADIVADIGFFALGCLAGALVGVFFAPSRGVELRENFKKAINEKGFIGGIGDQMKQPVQGQA